MHNLTKNIEFPSHLKPLYKKAIFYEWLSLFYMISAAFFSFIVMSNSQTMKTIWLEDTLGIIPPLAFLISSKLINKRANHNFPYGFHRVTSMLHFASSLALFILGFYLFIDGSIVLLKQEHPTIPTVYFFGQSIWLGFFMLVALCWSSIPSTLLGHIKIILAKPLADKILFADSNMSKASWMAGFASIIGIVCIGFGYWWADALAGLFIAISIIKDGIDNLKRAILDLLDEVPTAIGDNKVDPILTEVEAIVKQEDWVKSATMRFRNEGHIFFGDIFLIAKEKNIEVKKLSQLKYKLENYHWRLHDIVIMPVLTAGASRKKSTN